MKTRMQLWFSFYLLVVTYSITYAQADRSTPSTFDVGPSFSAGISMFSGTTPEDITPWPRTAYSFGLMSILYSSDNLSLMAAVSYDSRSFHFESMTDPNPYHTIRANYLSLQHGVKWKQLFLFLVVGLPLSAQQTVKPDPYIYTTEQNPDPIEVRSESIESGILLEARFGTLLPVVLLDNKDHLDFFAFGSYGVTKIGGEDGFYTISSFSPKITPTVITSVQVGLSYFFSLR